jgi:hypothetical protein
MGRATAIHDVWSWSKFSMSGYIQKRSGIDDVLQSVTPSLLPLLIDRVKLVEA